MIQLYQINSALFGKTLRELAVMMHAAEALNDDITFLEVCNEVNRRNAEDAYQLHYNKVWHEIKELEVKK